MYDICIYVYNSTPIYGYVLTILYIGGIAASIETILIFKLHFSSTLCMGTYIYMGIVLHATSNTIA